MAITFNPQINYSKRTSANQSFGDAPLAENALAATPPPTQTAPSAQPTQAPKRTAKGFIAKVAYAWVNLVEGTKGIVSGLLAGFAAGTTVAGADWLISGLKKTFKPGEGAVLTSKLERFKDMFKHPKAQLGKFGKIGAPIIAVGVLAAHLISARLKANQRTANVDHMLYEGHRDK